MGRAHEEIPPPVGALLRRGPDGLRAYRGEKNVTRIEGVPALTSRGARPGSQG